MAHDASGSPLSPHPVSESARADEHFHIALLTGGSDKPYAIGLVQALSDRCIRMDVVGSDELDCKEITQSSGVTFLNLRGDQRSDAPLHRKLLRVSTYYFKLLRYVTVIRPRIIHILWNNRFEMIDRTVLMLYYRLLGCRVVLTAHNVNVAKRDGRDGPANRLSLKIQYRLCTHLFVHTERMKQELVSEFGVAADNVTVVSFGINETIPTTALTAEQARRTLGLQVTERVALFFGQIAPYKGLEYLIDAMARLDGPQTLKLIVAGKVKSGHWDYWDAIRRTIAKPELRDRVIAVIGFIPDEDVERYFKSADVVVIPYTEIFQSGVPFLAFSFGLPVIATDVGSLREDVIDGQTGFTCAPRDAAALATTITRYFSSELYRNLSLRRNQIRIMTRERHSWTTVAEITRNVYERLLA